MYHVVSMNDVTRQDAELLIEVAEQLRGTPRQALRTRLMGTLVATLFYEPSTRTRLSFEAAVSRLGGNIVGAENARENSSAKKGETLADVFRVVGAYADAIVIRHHETNAISEALPFSPVPIISAGAGAGEHPTQSLLDVYTLWRELGRVDALRVCIMGDLKYGRTVHSLLRLLAKFSGVHVTIVHPDSLGLPEALLQQVTREGLVVERARDVVHAMSGADAIYQTRIQRERLHSEAEAATAEDYVIHARHLEHIPPHTPILHPLPRVDEISSQVDSDNRAAYFRQVENGLYLRMAMMDQILGGVIR